MKIGNIRIRISDKMVDLLREAEDVGTDKTKPELYNAIAGIYASRILGICFYRNDELKKIANKKSLVS